MCGICGVFTSDGYRAGSAIFNMATALRHRGPDDEGYLLGNTTQHSWIKATGPETITQIPKNPISHNADGQFNLAFGMRRLAIIDLSSSGHGPMTYNNGSYWITYNGEIYNYIELKQELTNLGHKFQTATDTEVILAAYAQWGPSCLARFNGMWAFAIWDVNKDKIFCARDRFGIKPFTYYWDGSLFAFASEAKALLRHPKIQTKPDDAAIFDYLVKGLSHHGERTFFEGIKNLLPAHYIELDLRNKRMDFHKWWDIPLNVNFESQKAGNENAVIEEFRALLIDTVRLSLRSDVPIGSCLSGGLDSSALVTIANRLLIDEQVLPPELIGKHQKTFSACFDDPEIDERPYIQEVIQSTKADAHYIFPQGRNGLWKEINVLHWHQEGPVGSTSIYSQWAVMRLAKEKGVTVLLDGQGADELLAGYTYYLGSYLSQAMRQKGLLFAIRELASASSMTQTPLLFLCGQMFYELLPASIRNFSQGVINTRIRTKKTLPLNYLADNFVRTFDDHRVVSYKNKGYDSLAEHLHDSIAFTSLPALLHYEDRNSMAFSIEARVPYLDYRLVELVFSLAANYKIRDGWTKWILREGTKGILPDRIRWRKRKLGFATPEKAWLNSNLGIIRDIFRGSVVSSKYLHPKLIQQFRKITEENVKLFPGFWRLTSLELWMRAFWR